MFHVPEEWRPVRGFPGYEVSSLGRVRDLYGLRKTSPDKDGYPRLHLRKDKKQYYRGVHRLVCEAFHGPPPFQGAQALHRDGNKSNTSPDNLYWGTHKQNMLDMVKSGTHCRGERHPDAQLTAEQVSCIRKEAYTHTYSTLAENMVYHFRISTTL